MTHPTAQANAVPAQNPPPTLDQIKARMKATWEDGDYARFATYMEPGAIEILNGWRIPPGQRLLDIGCGAGQTAIPAARLGHRVVGIDIAENLVERAQARARLEGVDAEFEVADAEALPYEEASFDVVISMIGAMFAPRPDKVVSEMARVLRPGGRLYMVNWTPRGMPAQMFKCVAAVTPPPPGFVSPVLWGDADTVAQRLSGRFEGLGFTTRCYPQWHYPFGPAELVDLFRTAFGPVKRAFDKLDDDPEGQAQLRRQLHEIYVLNGETDARGAISITGGEYLEVVATRTGAA